MVEDNPRDAEIAVRALQRAGYEFDWVRVDTETAFLAELNTVPDLILSDCAMPQFSGMRALELTRARGIDIPFILVSGTIGEDVAVGFIKAGADDYLIKDRLTRLGASVASGLKNKRLRDEHRLEGQRKLSAEQVRKAVYDISDASDRTQSLRELYQSVHEIIGRVMPARNFYIALREDPARDVLTYPYYVDEKKTEHAPVTLGRGLTSYVLRSGTSLLCPHALEEKLVEEGKVIAGIPTAVWLGIPLRVEGSIIGVMAVHDYDNPLAFGEPEREMLEFVSSQVAKAIHKKRSDEHRDLQARVMEAAANTMFIADRSRKITWVNSAFTTLTGYSASEAVGQKLDILRSGSHPEAVYQDISETLERGQTWQGELIERKKDGELYAARTIITPVKDEAGNFTHVISVKQDITRERELETQFRKAQKMEAVGTLAAGIAHDFNNHLAVILGFTEVLQERLRTDSVSQDKLAQVQSATLRAASLTKQLLAFSRQQVLQPVVLDLNTSIQELEKMLRRVISENIDVVFNPCPDLGRICADPTQIDQILLNLAINARDAMPDGGRLTIETANVELDAEYASQNIACKAGPHVMLAISDTGTGMDKDTQARIFEPFFTTKEPGKGTGLGLSTVYGIVKQSGGFIWVYSELGRGTAFKIYFPAVIEKVQAKPERVVLKTAEARGEAIFLVEDTPPLLEVMREMLESVGYTVHAFDSPMEALKAAGQTSNAPALLITDLIMPVISGQDLSDRITALHPGTKVMYMSGYTDDTVLRLGIQDSGWGFIQKPFNRNELTQKVRAMLDSAN
jgi:PAS domain S-box-containing protein